MFADDDDWNYHVSIYINLVVVKDNNIILLGDGGKVTNYELRITNERQTAKGVAKSRGGPNKSISVELVLLNAYVSITSYNASTNQSNINYLTFTILFYFDH